MLKKNSASLLKTFVFAGSVALAFALPKPASADNLSDALIGAYKNSGLLEQNRALLRVQDENVAAAVAGLRPIVNWTIRASTQNTHTVNGQSPSSSVDQLTTGLAVGAGWEWWRGPDGVPAVGQPSAAAAASA